MTKEISRKLYALSFFMTMAIVIYHAHGWIYSYILKSTFPFSNFPRNVSFQFYETIGSLSLGYFFAVTGFWLYYHTSKNAVWQKILKRWKTLLIPLTVWNIVYIFLDFAIGGALPFHDLKTFLLGFTLIPFDGPLWYIFVVVLFTPLAPIILRLKGNSRLQLAFIFVFLAVSFYFSNFYQGSFVRTEYWSWIERTLRYFSTYLVGASLGMNKAFRTKLQSLTHSNWRYVAAVVYLITVLLCGANISNWLVWLMLRLQPILMWIAIDDRWFTKDIPEQMRFTFLIYATHRFIMTFSTNVVVAHFGWQLPSTLWIAMSLPVMYSLIVYVANLFLYCVLKKILRPKGWMLLTGGR